MYSLRLRIYNDGKGICDLAHWYYYHRRDSLTVWFRILGYGLYFASNYGGHWKFKILRRNK